MLNCVNSEIVRAVFTRALFSADHNNVSVPGNSRSFKANPKYFQLSDWLKYRITLSRALCQVSDIIHVFTIYWKHSPPSKNPDNLLGLKWALHSIPEWSVNSEGRLTSLSSYTQLNFMLFKNVVSNAVLYSAKCGRKMTWIWWVTKCLKRDVFGVFEFTWRDWR